MKAILSEKEFELAMGCGEDNICLLENVAKLSVNKVIAGSIGMLGKKYIVSIKLINKDGQTERMLKESCSCPIEDLEKTIETISYRFLKHLGGEEVSAPESVVSREETTYKTLSVFAVQSMPNISISKKKKWGFYGYSTIKHDYNLKTIRGDKVVVDKATGLMWHQGGSDNFVALDEAKEWVRNLEYAGYSDWKLPTLEEAVSLLESSKKNSDLYIDPVFSNKQSFIWTGDRYGSEVAWGVGFGKGSVYRLSYYNVFYVRPVRSIK
jgi:hypothetical protein